MEIIERCNLAVGMRDDLVHGVLRDMKPVNGAWVFDKLDHAGDVYVYRPVTVDGIYIQKLVDESVSLGTAILNLSKQIHAL